MDMLFCALMAALGPTLRGSGHVHGQNLQLQLIGKTSMGYVLGWHFARFYQRCVGTL